MVSAQKEWASVMAPNHTSYLPWEISLRFLSTSVLVSKLVTISYSASRGLNGTRDVKQRSYQALIHLNSLSPIKFRGTKEETTEEKKIF